MIGDLMDGGIRLAPAQNYDAADSLIARSMVTTGEMTSTDLLLGAIAHSLQGLLKIQMEA